MLSGVVFKNVKANESLGKDVRYTIRMNESMVVATDSLRRRYGYNNFFATIVLVLI